jgi:hypothetical protein
MTHESQSHEALLDREHTEASVQRIFGSALNVLRELIDEATHLQVRALKTSQRETFDVVLLGTLFPRIMKLLDTIEILSRAGQAYGARPSLRSLIEGAWGIEWMVHADFERRGRQYYVVELRDRIGENEAFTPGTKAYQRMAEDVSSERLRELLRGTNGEGIASSEIRRIWDHINSEPELLVISQEIDRQGKSPPNVRWFQLFDGPSDYRKLARSLGRGDEYQFSYQALSHAVHGTLAQDHVWIEKRGLARMQPIRAIQGVTEILDLTWALALRIYSLVLTHYRPEEIPAFRSRFFPQGKSRFIIPEFEVQQDMRIL